MALPPRSFPEIRGRRCGEDWTVPTVVTGKLPKIPFGNNYRHTIYPVTASVALVLNIADDRDQLEYLESQIRSNVRRIDGYLRRDEPDYLSFSMNETKQIAWLLAHALAELDSALRLVANWDDYGWPIETGDTYKHVADRCYSDTPVPPGQEEAYHFRCPEPTQLAVRKADRKAIGRAVSDSLAHLYCAEYGYWRLRLFKQAAHAYLQREAAGGQDTLVTPTVPVDPCKDFGIGCPPGEGPEGCPSGLCVDPDTLPDPTDVPLGEPGVIPADIHEATSRAPVYVIAGGGVLLAATIIYVALAD
jgi:hypothetical protein